MTWTTSSGIDEGPSYFLIKGQTLNIIELQGRDSKGTKREDPNLSFNIYLVFDRYFAD